MNDPTPNLEELAARLEKYEKEELKRLNKQMDDVYYEYHIRWMRESWRNPHDIHPKPIKPHKQQNKWPRTRSNPKLR